MATIFKGKSFEDSGATPLNRVELAGALIQQADVSAIDYVVKDAQSLEVVREATALDKTVVIFDALQTDGRWTLDETGYNFRHDLPAADLPNGRRTYRVEYKITPTAGEVFHIVWEIETLNLLRS